jgi:hypothetical protein
MKITDTIKSFSPLELTLIIVFVLYIILPIKTPFFMAPYVNSSLGILSIFVVTVFLFLYTNPILAILYILVGYELLRRSSEAGIFDSSLLNNYPLAKNPKVKEIVPLFKKEVTIEQERNTLEEEVVAKMAPIGRSEQKVAISSSYNPVSSTINGASLY